jgi:hypothetical protein
MKVHRACIAFARIAAVLASPLLLGSGCGSSGTAPASTNPNCGKDGYICAPPGLPYVRAAAAVSDLCGGLVAGCALATNPPAGSTTANLTQPESGKVCLAGTVAAGGVAVLVLGFSDWNQDGTAILETFDPTHLGITQASFTIDSPLTGSLAVGAATTPPAPVDCPEASCLTNFDLGTSPTSGVNMSFPAPGPQVASFANFHASGGGGQTFDPTALDLLAFATTGAGDYAFCISDFKLLDAAGNEVTP